MFYIKEQSTFHQALFGTFCTNACIMSSQKSGELIEINTLKLTFFIGENE